MWINTRTVDTYSDEAVRELVDAGLADIVEHPETGEPMFRLTPAGIQAAKELEEPS